MELLLFLALHGTILVREALECLCSLGLRKPGQFEAGRQVPVPMSSAQLDWNLRAALHFILNKIGITLLFFFLCNFLGMVAWDLWMNSTTQNQHFMQVPGWHAGELLAGGQTSWKASVLFSALCWDWQCLSILFSHHTCWFGGNERSGGVKCWD